MASRSPPARRTTAVRATAQDRSSAIAVQPRDRDHVRPLAAAWRVSSVQAATGYKRRPAPRPAPNSPRCPSAAGPAQAPVAGRRRKFGPGHRRSAGYSRPRARYLLSARLLRHCLFQAGTVAGLTTVGRTPGLSPTFSKARGPTGCSRYTLRGCKFCSKVHLVGPDARWVDVRISLARISTADRR